MEPVADQKIYSNRYQLTHLIARGGMAMVYRAHDLLLNRYVALKILYPELSVDHSFVERFRREAQAAANLSHPNIVPVFDWGEEDGTYFIVMELIEGTSLAELLRDSRTLSPAKSAQVCAQVAAALSYAHRQGVVHRDVKPGNILLTADGSVKVTDFGIAQAISTEDNLTVAGSVMGTATYFSPEQAEGALVDGRSDVYSLGVVLYELLAGRPPFIGETPVAVASKHVREVVPSPRQFNPSLPSDLEAITLHALAKAPGDRYQTADEFRADLLRFAEGQPVSVSGARAIMGDDVTTAVATVAAVGPKTQAVPIMSGPRTDVKKRKKWLPWAIAGALIAVVAAAGIILGLSSSKSVTRMPNVIGETIEAAYNTLRNDGLVPGPTQLVVSSKPIGTVDSTKPNPGEKVTKGQTVTLYISQGSGATEVTIPNVQNMALADAEAQLQGAGLVPKVEFTTTGGTVPNQVISQSPQGGTKGHTGDTVVLVVLSPSTKFPIPDVTGQSPTAAAGNLGASGLVVAATTTSKCSNSIASGLVVMTNPVAGTLVSSGTSVQLVTSSGVCDVIVPNVTGQTQANATASLTAQGLLANYITGDSTTCASFSDYVFSQDLSPGSSAPYHSTVNLTYCPATG